MTERITQFKGRYDFLSNFYFCEVVYQKMSYPSVEHAFQAAKTLDKAERRRIQALPTPGMAKRAGRRVELRKDWEAIKLIIMTNLVFDKFERHDELAIKLLETAPARLIENNYWHDNFWGNCTCEKCEPIGGLNRLGQILMIARDELELR